MSKEYGLQDLLEELAERRAFDFRGYKRTTLERRFRKRMFQLNMGEYKDYAEYIRKHPEEANTLLTTILINVTEFFRDPPAWEVLRNDVLPPILSKLKPGSPFRVWSAGCASGEEPYSAAILLAEYFGPRLPEYDVRIYATDIDDEELNTARRGTYTAEALRRIRPAWREKYFHERNGYRINRDLRKLVIFGKSNLAQHAPISHVDLLICRNVLIYFDAALQCHILTRLHYALEPGGILFLGRSESQLSNSTQFQRLNARWRIFRRTSQRLIDGIRTEFHAEDNVASQSEPGTPEMERLRIQQRYLLDSLRTGVVILGPDDVIIQHNNAVLTMLGLPMTSLVGKRIEETDIPARAPEIASDTHRTLQDSEYTRLQTRIRAGAEERPVEIIIRPLLSDRMERTGTLIYFDDGSLQEKLQTTIEVLESTTEELQSANEELETTNEELQSTNEELETTNEELQSTNEELETTNEELQSLNEELETTNQELEERTKEIDQLNSIYGQTLEQMRLPVLLVDAEGRIEFWNTIALRMFGFKSKPPMSFRLEQLPIPAPLRHVLIRRHSAVLQKRQPIVARNLSFGGKFSSADVHLSVIPREDKGTSVLFMFEPRNSAHEPEPKGAASKNNANRRNRLR